VFVAENEVEREELTTSTGDELSLFPLDVGKIDVETLVGLMDNVDVCVNEEAISVTGVDEIEGVVSLDTKAICAKTEKKRL
jgi:hypothetical protein